MDKTSTQPSPDKAHAEREEKTIAATTHINPRAARRCWTPQEARNFNAWDK
jgi:hypothetical protein|tara:strand:- start:101 stop:253 length:153 start_codon:yes stop_codon:yes gene_type:complete